MTTSENKLALSKKIDNCCQKAEHIGMAIAKEFKKCALIIGILSACARALHVGTLYVEAFSQ